MATVAVAVTSFPTGIQGQRCSWPREIENGCVRGEHASWLHFAKFRVVERVEAFTGEGPVDIES